ncbi:hypothetical protein BKA81DRAFT_382552 [Phyllosticta paracitricarpa]|uniref:Uncharacterized protein n=1 Tax=Phyllosticta citricarpa TaxID=55181 RepID=A0ABR1MJI0_9PEZI
MAIGPAIGDIQSCWPTATIVEQETLLTGRGLYSPGTICPVGYTTACASRSARSARRAQVCTHPTFDFQYAAENGETVVGCCPTGFQCIRDMNGRQTCMGVASSTSVSLETCQSNGSATNPAEISLPWRESEVVRSGISLSAPLIQMAWKSSDVTGKIEATAGCANDAPTSNSDGLSKSASVAVAVVVPIVVLGSVIGFFVWALHKRKMQLARARQQPLMMVEPSHAQAVQQLPANEILELEVTLRPAEKPAGAGQEAR